MSTDLLASLLSRIGHLGKCRCTFESGARPVLDRVWEEDAKAKRLLQARPESRQPRIATVRWYVSHQVEALSRRRRTGG